MHGELVQIFVGQGGAQIADACWELFTQEHFITPSGEPSACLCGQEQGDCDGSAFFSLTQRGFFVPRTLIVDTEPSVLDEIRMGVYRNLFQPSSLISGCEDSASNFARGYYGAPCSLIDASYNSIRRLAEACDLLHGIIFYRTYGGGTGSGLGCRLLQHAADEFCKISRMDFGVIPGVTLSSGPVEPYNAVLATQVPVEHVNLVSLVDNMALQRICSCLLKIYKPSFTSLNRILAQCMSGLTSTFRFPGPTTITMMDLYTNLVPYPDAHFAMIGFAPLFDLETACKGQVDTTQLTESVFAPENQLVHQHGEEVNMYLTCCLFYRGNASVRDVNTCIDEMRSSNRLPFVDWCPTGFKVGISYQPMTTIEASRIGPSDTSVMALHNSTLFRTPLHELTQAVETLLKRNAFLHWYKAEGIERDEIENALGGLKKLEADYNSFINTSLERKFSNERMGKSCPLVQSKVNGEEGMNCEQETKSPCCEKSDTPSSMKRQRINPFCRKEFDRNYQPPQESLRSPSYSEKGQRPFSRCRTDCKDRGSSRKSPLITNITPRSGTPKSRNSGCPAKDYTKVMDREASPEALEPTICSQKTCTRSSQTMRCPKECDGRCKTERETPSQENSTDYESEQERSSRCRRRRREWEYNFRKYLRDKPSHDEDANSGPFDTDLHCQRRMAPGCRATKQSEAIEEDRTRNPSAKRPACGSFTPSPPQYLQKCSISYQNGRECYESSLREALEIIDKAYEASRCKSEMSDEEPESVIEANYDSCNTDSASQSDICRNNYENETAPRVPKQRFCRSPGYSYRNDKGRHNVEVNTDETKRQNYLRHFSPTPLPEDTSSTSMNLSVPSSSSSSLSKLRKFLAVHSPECLRKAKCSHSSSMSTTANLATSALLNEEIVRELERSVKSELSSVLDALGHVVIPPSCTPATGTNQHHHRHHHYHRHNRFKHTRS
ncbi:tubulin alpha [Echinococcus multilocularis]|uniref:Tubulin alpha n=1 Tax=Echinococcus multilocularis TaxID=6211 RepID=A0A068XZP7_ECHMU|nr:tubulin alpha [Echinococcus multilocularis]